MQEVISWLKMLREGENLRMSVEEPLQELKKGEFMGRDQASPHKTKCVYPQITASSQAGYRCGVPFSSSFEISSHLLTHESIFPLK